MEYRSGRIGKRTAGQDWIGSFPDLGGLPSFVWEFACFGLFRKFQLRDKVALGIFGSRSLWELSDACDAAEECRGPLRLRSGQAFDWRDLSQGERSRCAQDDRSQRASGRQA
jgi:hypothetical protein